MSGKKTCCVWGCLNTYNKNPSLSFFTLPTDITRRNMWLELISRQDLMNKNHKSYVVCEIHFEEQYIVQHSKCKILSRKALPSFHLPLCFEVLPQQPPQEQKQQLPQQAQQHKEIQVDILCSTGADDNFDCEDVSFASDAEAEGAELDSCDFYCKKCEKRLIKWRFVCVQCVRYEVCGACAARGDHPRHYLLRLPGDSHSGKAEEVLNLVRSSLIVNLKDDATVPQEGDPLVEVKIEPPEYIRVIKVEVKEEPTEYEDPLNDTVPDMDSKMELSSMRLAALDSILKTNESDFDSKPQSKRTSTPLKITNAKKIKTENVQIAKIGNEKSTQSKTSASQKLERDRTSNAVLNKNETVLDITAQETKVCKKKKETISSSTGKTTPKGNVPDEFTLIDPVKIEISVEDNLGNRVDSLTVIEDMAEKKEKTTIREND